MSAYRIKSSSQSKYYQTRRSHSYPLRPPAHETDSSVSDRSDLVIYPDEEAVTQARAEAIKSVPEGRRKELKKKMATRSPRRTNSESKVYDVNISKVIGSSMPRKDGGRSEHRPHKSRRERLDDRDEVIYVRQMGRGSYGELEERARSNDLRRSKTTGGTSKARHERSYVENRATERRHSDRWTSRREEERHDTPLRKERRLVTDDISRTRRAEPSQR